MSTASVPLTWQDQSVLDLERTSPWNIAVEIAGDVVVDVARLRASVDAACRRHPMMRARLRPGNPLASSSSWRIGEDVDVPVQSVTVRTDPDLDALRTSFHAPPFDLTTDAPLRLAVASRPGEGDVVLVCAAHPVVDGIGLVRFLQTLTRHYRGAEDPADPVSLAQARDLDAILAPTSAGDVARRALEGGLKLAGTLNPPARVRRDSTDDRDLPAFRQATLDADDVARLQAARPGGATLNDVLLAAVMVTIARWNLDHGADPDKIQLLVPVNLRPAGWRTDMVMNMFSYVSVTTVRSERPDLAAAAAAVHRHTRPDARSGRARGTQDLLRLVSPVPLGIKAMLPRLLDLTGNRFVDSAVVSNLGAPDDVPRFGDALPSRVDFTPPYWGAALVSLGAIAVGGELHIGLRHRLSHLDVDAARRFTELLLTVLRSAAPTT